MALTEKYGSRKEVHAAMRGGKNSGNFLRLKDGNRIKVHFLTEMDQWERGFYHYYNEKFLWCSRRDDCPACEADNKPNRVWLANVLERETGKVSVLQVPYTISEQLADKDEKYETITDRDYEISRKGAGKNDTRYSLDWDSPRSFNAKRYKLIDIAASILIELGLNDDDDEEEEDEEPRTAKKSRPARSSSRRSRDDEDDEDEDTDDEEDDEVEEEERPRKSSKKSSRDGLDEFRSGKSKHPAAKSSGGTRVVRRSR